MLIQSQDFIIYKEKKKNHKIVDDALKRSVPTHPLRKHCACKYFR